jgi:membrane-bound inhibitor of C-type lysozyme
MEVIMNKTFLILILVVFFSACADGNRIKPGSDRDAHGCIGSAGYSWCEERQTCIRVWEEPCTAAKVIKAVYECKGLGTINVDYYGQEAASVGTQSGKYKLERAISGSGARYTGNNIMFWDKAGKASLELEGKTYNCTVK